MCTAVVDADFVVCKIVECTAKRVGHKCPADPRVVKLVIASDYVGVAVGVVAAVDIIEILSLSTYDVTMSAGESCCVFESVVVLAVVSICDGPSVCVSYVEFECLTVATFNNEEVIAEARFLSDYVVVVPEVLISVDVEVEVVDVNEANDNVVDIFTFEFVVISDSGDGKLSFASTLELE